MGSLRSPVMSQIIDDEWRREKFTDLDIIVSSKTVQIKLNMDQGDEESQQRIPITEVKEWVDPGFGELITPFTEPNLDRLNLHVDPDHDANNDDERPSLGNLR